MLYFSLLPKIEYIDTGIKAADQESSPWSNNSPRGPLVPVRRACFPSIPSNQILVDSIISEIQKSKTISIFLIFYAILSGKN